MATNFPPEFLNSKMPSGLPPHSLKLKRGTIVVLLRNLNPKEGLCNGTRLRIENIQVSLLTAAVITGPKSGIVVLLPRITLMADESSLPCKMSRYQFPIRVAFAMTINKAQGQTLSKVGVFLPQPVFSHGQLYVAFSRVKKQTDIKICVPRTTRSGGNVVMTQNIVYDEVL